RRARGCRARAPHDRVAFCGGRGPWLDHRAWEEAAMRMDSDGCGRMGVHARRRHGPAAGDGSGWALVLCPDRGPRARRLSCGVACRVGAYRGTTRTQVSTPWHIGEMRAPRRPGMPGAT